MKEYKNIEYDGRVFDFHFHAHWEGTSVDLYNSNPFVGDDGKEHVHTLSNRTLEKLVKEQEMKK